MAVDHDRRPRTAGLRTVEARLPMHRGAEAMRAAPSQSSPASGGGHMDLRSAACGGGQGGARGQGAAPAARPDASGWRRVGGRLAGPPLRAMQSRWMRRIGIGMAAVAAIFVLVAGGLWLMLASGPISLDIATPWLAAAVAENFGNQFRIDIGGTVLERDEHGRTAMRIRSITVRDHDGTVVASAPKAEVGFSGASLLSGRPRAQRLNLVGAELAVRIEADGKVTVSTGADQRPLAMHRRWPRAGCEEVRSPLPPLPRQRGRLNRYTPRKRGR